MQLFFSINSGIKLQLILVQPIVGQLVRNVMDQKCRSAQLNVNSFTSGPEASELSFLKNDYSLTLKVIGYVFNMNKKVVFVTRLFKLKLD